MQVLQLSLKHELYNSISLFQYFNTLLVLHLKKKKEKRNKKGVHRNDYTKNQKNAWFLYGVVEIVLVWNTCEVILPQNNCQYSDTSQCWRTANYQGTEKFDVQWCLHIFLFWTSPVTTDVSEQVFLQSWSFLHDNHLLPEHHQLR